MPFREKTQRWDLFHVILEALKYGFSLSKSAASYGFTLLFYIVKLIISEPFLELYNVFDNFEGFKNVMVHHLYLVSSYITQKTAKNTKSPSDFTKGVPATVQ